MSSQLLEPGLLSVVVDASAGVDVVVLIEVVDGASVVVVVGPKLQFVSFPTILCITRPRSQLRFSKIRALKIIASTCQWYQSTRLDLK